MRVGLIVGAWAFAAFVSGFASGRMSAEQHWYAKVLPGVLWHDAALQSDDLTVPTMSGYLAMGYTTDYKHSVSEGDAAVIRIDRATGLVLAKCTEK